jgi:Pyruvate/2-oxoacid:ferredoxin oxidoreductase gamma subunit
MVLLGAYVGAVKPVPAEVVEGEISKRFGKDSRLLALNVGAFREGVKLATGNAWV